MYQLDYICPKGDRDPHHEAFIGHAIAPVVINKFNGARYCGKRAARTFAEMQRPELQDDGSYACPKGFKACNEGFFEKPSGQDYVICYPNNEERDENCPITDLLFIDPAG